MFTLTIAVLLTVVVLIVWAICEWVVFPFCRWTVLFITSMIAHQSYWSWRLSIRDRLRITAHAVILRSPFVAALTIIWLWIA